MIIQKQNEKEEKKRKLHKNYDKISVDIVRALSVANSSGSFFSFQAGRTWTYTHKNQRHNDNEK